MKIGVLGTGFGVVHLQTFLKHPLVDEVVFFSRTQRKVNELSAQMGLRGTTDLDEILCDSTVDVVTIAFAISVPCIHRWFGAERASACYISYMQSLPTWGAQRQGKASAISVAKND